MRFLVKLWQTKQKLSILQYFLLSCQYFKSYTFTYHQGSLRFENIFVAYKVPNLVMLYYYIFSWLFLYFLYPEFFFSSTVFEFVLYYKYHNIIINDNKLDYDYITKCVTSVNIISSKNSYTVRHVRPICPIWSQSHPLGHKSATTIHGSELGLTLC